MEITLNGTECFLLGATTNERLLYMHNPRIQADQYSAPNPFMWLLPRDPENFEDFLFRLRRN